MWRADLTAPAAVTRTDRPRGMVLQGILQHLPAEGGSEAEALSDLELALLRRISHEARPRRAGATQGIAKPAAQVQFDAGPASGVDKLAAGLGVPSASVDDALCSILEKLEKKGGGSIEQK
jgi:hypothetical protein